MKKTCKKDVANQPNMHQTPQTRHHSVSRPLGRRDCRYWPWRCMTKGALYVIIFLNCIFITLTLLNLLLSSEDGLQTDAIRAVPRDKLPSEESNREKAINNTDTARDSIDTINIVAVKEVESGSREQPKKVYLDIDAHNRYLKEALQFINQPRYNCSQYPRAVDIAICVHSRLSHYDQRNAIRNTWAKVLRDKPKLYSHVLLVFVLGGGGRYRPHINIKEIEHGDIVVGNFEDSFRNNTLKTLLQIKWLIAGRCLKQNAVIVSVPDDVYINIPLMCTNLLPIINSGSASIRRLWIGDIRKGQAPQRNSTSRYYLSTKEFPDDTLPTFCAGAIGHMLSSAAAKYLLYDWSWNYRIPSLMDVFIGKAAEAGHWFIRSIPSIIPDARKSGVCETDSRTISMGLRYSWQMIKFHEARRLCVNPEVDMTSNNTSNKGLLQSTLQFSTNPSRACEDASSGKPLNEIFLIMLISSKPIDFSHREAIRKTWGKLTTIQGREVRVIFVLGAYTHQSITVTKKLQQEADTYHDLLILSAVEESHTTSRTLKLIGALKWVSRHCPYARFMYKGDDDTFVNIDLMVAHLSYTKHSPDGQVDGSYYSPVSIDHYIRKVKLYMGSLYEDNVDRSSGPPSQTDHVTYFPPFVSTNGYILSGDVIPALYNASLSLEMLISDDVYQGLLAKRIGLKVMRHNGFRSKGFRNAVFRSDIDTCTIRRGIWTMKMHGFVDKSLTDVWTRFLSPSTICDV